MWKNFYSMHLSHGQLHKLRQAGCIFGEQKPTKNHKYTLTRANVEQGAMEESWWKLSPGAAEQKKMELAWTCTEEKLSQHTQAGSTVDTARAQKKRTTQEHV